MGDSFAKARQRGRRSPRAGGAVAPAVVGSWVAGGRNEAGSTSGGGRPPKREPSPILIVCYRTSPACPAGTAGGPPAVKLGPAAPLDGRFPGRAGKKGRIGRRSGRPVSQQP